VRPLLWKEMRDLRPMLLGAAALWLVLELLCLNRRFAEGFLTAYLSTMPLVALMAAVGLGAGQMARERASKTLDFLLARPIAPAAIVWIKFLAGSVALALVAAAMFALCYAGPPPQSHNYLIALRSTVGFPQLAAVAFPRLWCVYALTLLLSALVDRTAKAAVAGFGCVLALGTLMEFHRELFPFSNIGAWQPMFVEGFPMGLRLMHDPALFRWTVMVFCALAPLLALAAALLFRRSPGRSLSNRALILGAAALAGLAGLSTYAAANRLPVLSPAGSMEIVPDRSNSSVVMSAGRGMVALAVGANRLEFLDFTDPARPRKAAEVRMPLWTTESLTVSGSQTYIMGSKKALPVDEIQIAIASPTPAGAVEFAEPVRLDKWDEGRFAGSIAASGQFAFVDVVRQRQCRIEVYDLSPGASPRQAAAVLVDEIVPQPWGKHEEIFVAGAMQMRLQGQFLYVTSPSALTAIDIRDPGRPVVASRTEYHAPILSMYGARRELASDGRWLLEAESLLQVWNVYDLADPAHPALRGHAPLNGYGDVAGSGPVLFQPWRDGLMEFHAASGGLEALRYLTDGRDNSIWTFAVADGAVYTWKRVEDRAFVSAYRVNR